jgi:hypothetical protein
MQSTNREVKKNCGCTEDSLINDFTSNCDTIVLRDGSKLYHQFNCDSIWLTLESAKGDKLIIDSWGDDFKELYPYHYRLGYHLLREFDKSLLFRSGCPANGPCNFILVDKATGLQLRQLENLIYDVERDEFFNFVIYLSEQRDSLFIEFIDQSNIIKVPVKGERFDSITPEQQFSGIKLNGNILSLTYTYFQGKVEKSDTISIDISTK